MTMSDSDKINWCVIRHNISSFSRKRESTEGGFGRRVTSETASVFDRHAQAVEPPTWDIIAPPFTIASAGRTLEIGPYDVALRRHRNWMATDEAKQAYLRRLPLIEPLFAIIKNQLGARQFRLRGIANVKAEWSLLATAFNLRTLWRVWRARTAACSALI